MNLLVAENISKAYGADTLFESVSFGINEGDKCGLIGVNGTGKSTLLRILAGEETSDSGSVTMRRELRIAYLPQTPLFDDSMSLVENVIAGKKASDEFRNIRGEAAAMLAKLGLPDPDTVPSTLSGGQRKRASLVRTLLTDSDLLILDEPTNHLDAGMTEWLEDILQNYKGAMICITHDRYFLDEVTNKIFELDKRCLYSYDANYSKFVELKAEREDSVLATERKAKSLYRQELAWMLRGARARSTKQKAHIERFKALRDRKEIEVTEDVKMFSISSRMGKKTLIADGITKAYGDKTLINDFSYTFLPNDRIGIVGPNGCGKTTLVKILADSLKPDSGSVEYGETIRFGYFAQEYSFDKPDMRVIDHVKDIAEVIHTDEGTVTASRMCERFLFNADKQYSPIGKLSGGEKRRLYLLSILMSAPNILILDEPTNDLDIATLTILEDYLQGFDGIIIAVSHDRYFLDKVVSKIFAFDNNGNIVRSEGTYTDYRNRMLDTLDETELKTAAVNDEQTERTAKVKTEKLRFSYKEQKEFETIEDDISAAERVIEEIDEQMNSSASEYSKLTELMHKKEDLTAELDRLTERWLYLTELKEKIDQQ